ncbi:MAG: ChrR family anti-sigma-E factor [Alphaproteobacteria bacterium]|nr:ChrR family anti-sigma-E factor [Alphaproteobacteria bacterium]
MTAVTAYEMRGQEPTHHLSDELLMDYASGALDEAGSLFVASHLTLCPHCRARLQALEAVGGALLDDIEPVSMADGAFDAIMAKIDAAGSANENAAPAEAERVVDGTVLPAPLRKYLGVDLDGVQWRKKGGGVAVAPVPGMGPEANAFLLKVEAGRAVPQHSHGGNEFVMVLKGGYSDASGHFGRGDVELADDDVDHQPIADDGEECVCLAVTDAPLRFTGKTGWLLNMFVKM